MSIDFEGADGPSEQDGFVERFSYWVSRRPDARAVTMLDAGDDESDVLTFAQLWGRSYSAAQALAAADLAGKPVLFLLPTSADFVCLFYGCMMSGAIAVPVPEPRTRRLKSWKNVIAIIESSGITDVVATEEITEAGKELAKTESGLEAVTFYTPEAFLGENVPRQDYDKPDLEAPAFLQFTSGSTGTPKGVILSHLNVDEMQRIIERRIAWPAGACMVSWLPVYHDMGLNMILHAHFRGLHAVLMTPTAFAQKPVRWLKAIDDYRAFVSAGANFAFDIAAKVLADPDCKRFDLSCWKQAICGSEPIHPSTVRRFLEAGEAHDFPPQTFMPSYGMAEAVVALSFDATDALPRIERLSRHEVELGRLVRVPEDAPGERYELVTAGIPLEDLDILVVDPESGQPLEEGLIGEIWVQAATVSKGFWRREEATREQFGFTIEGREGEYVRSGDLGGLIDGHVIITGRKKEMIIVNGRNLFPTDIERSLQESHEALANHAGASFAVTEDGRERIVIVQEVKRTALRQLDETEVFQSIVAAISEDFAVSPSEIILLSPATLPKTTSGKIPRKRVRAEYLEGRLKGIAHWKAAPGSAGDAPVLSLSDMEIAGISAGRVHVLEGVIRRTLSRHLGIEESAVALDRPFFELGVSSVQAVQFVAALGGALSIELDPTTLWRFPTVADLAAHIVSELTGPAAAAAPEAVGDGARTKKGARELDEAALKEMSEDEALARLEDLLD